MNIFWLDKDLRKCAEYHCDKHIVKMATEYVQLLSTAVRLTRGDERMMLEGERIRNGVIVSRRAYNVTHKNHPCAVWARETMENWKALKLLAEHTCAVYTERYGRIHGAQLVLDQLPNPKLPRGGLTKPPLTMPDEYKGGGVITSYRRFYRESKSRFAEWRYSPTPRWMKL